MRGSIIVVTLIVSLASCARMQPIYDVYNQPSFPNSAKLYLDMPLNVHVSMFSDEKCSLGEHGTHVEYDYYAGGSDVVGYRAQHSFEGKMQSINIEANKPQVINFTHQEKKVN